MKLAQEPIADLVATVAVAIAAGATVVAVVVVTGEAEDATKIAIVGAAATTASRVGKFLAQRRLVGPTTKRQSRMALKRRFRSLPFVLVRTPPACFTAIHLNVEH